MSENTALTPEFLNFLQEHRSDIESLYKDAFKKLKDEAKSKADEIENLINLENTGFRSFNYNPGNQLKFVRVFEKEIEWEGKKFNIKIKLRFRPAKCTVEIWVEKSSETKIFQDYISQIFDKDFDDWKNHQDNELGSIEYSEFKLAPDAENVSKEIEHLILKINLTSD
ncbi:MAG: hypothetical protein U5K69_12005 [Balneolaceae bacterium]|nr:hypothetical protein [Balneolaceae bacterium]